MRLTKLIESFLQNENTPYFLNLHGKSIQHELAQGDQASFGQELFPIEP
jgi:hypothetical protein